MMTVRQFPDRNGLTVLLTIRFSHGRVQWLSYITPKTRTAPATMEFGLEVI